MAIGVGIAQEEDVLGQARRLGLCGEGRDRLGQKVVLSVRAAIEFEIEPLAAGGDHARRTVFDCDGRRGGRRRIWGPHPRHRDDQLRHIMAAGAGKPGVIRPREGLLQKEILARLQAARFTAQQLGMIVAVEIEQEANVAVAQIGVLRQPPFVLPSLEEFAESGRRLRVGRGAPRVETPLRRGEDDPPGFHPRQEGKARGRTPIEAEHPGLGVQIHSREEVADRRRAVEVQHVAAAKDDPLGMAGPPQIEALFADADDEFIERNFALRGHAGP